MFLISIEAYAMNTASEQRWAEQLRDNIVIGDAVDLPLSASKSTPDSSATENSNSFFSIYTPHTTTKSNAAIVLMHGTEAHPDWNDIIHPLRVELPDKGWATLSIQLPLVFPTSDNKQEEDLQSRTQVIESSVPRIDAAINFLRAKGYDYISIVAHSFGTLMSLNYLQRKVDKVTAKGTLVINSAVIIGTPSSGTSAPLNSPVMIEKIKIPLLDLYGSKDLDSVMRSAKARKTAARKIPNKQFRQVQTIGADHFYRGLDEELVLYITNWLNKTHSRAAVHKTQK
ncbi:MAG: alpha/beta hydrolase family protein [Thiohalomonas sp.]|nr:alpha/beta hydrolase family protein [Thiohalomonas sp.]